MCREFAAGFGCEIESVQSNHEGVLVDAIHQAHQEFKQGECIGIVFNPGAYTHTSIALHAAVMGTDTPVIEVHITNVHKREAFRHHSYISPAAGTIIGMGTRGYRLALSALLEA